MNSWNSSPRLMDPEQGMASPRQLSRPRSGRGPTVGGGGGGDAGQEMMQQVEGQDMGSARGTHHSHGQGQGVYRDSSLRQRPSSAHAPDAARRSVSNIKSRYQTQGGQQQAQPQAWDAGGTGMYVDMPASPSASVGMRTLLSPRMMSSGDLRPMASPRR